LATLSGRIQSKLKKLGIIDKIGGEEYIAKNTTEAIDRAKEKLKSAQSSDGVRE
jgi:hypothetical protein